MKNTKYYQCALLNSSKILQEDAKENLYYDFTKLNKDDLSSWLDQACQEGDLSLVRYLLTSNELKIKPNVHGAVEFTNHQGTYYDEQPLYYAVSNNRIEIVKYLLTSKELKEHANIRYSHDHLLVVAARHGHIEMLDFLLSGKSIDNPELTITVFSQMGEYPEALPAIKYLLNHEKYKTLLDMHDEENYILTTVCSSGNLEMLNYLLTSPELEKKPKFSKKSNYVVRMLQYNNIEVADYLLHHTELKDYFNVQGGLNRIKVLCNNKHNEALEYLLFNYAIKTPQRINQMMANKVCEYATDDLLEQIVYSWQIPYLENIKNGNNSQLKEAFEKRELNRQLELKLSENKSSSKRKKI